PATECRSAKKPDLCVRSYTEIVSRAALRHENSSDRLKAASRQRLTFPSSHTKSAIAFAIPDISAGLNTCAPFPAISASAPPSEHTTAQPHDMASTNGKPKPS